MRSNQDEHRNNKRVANETRSTVSANVFTNYDRPDEKHQLLTLRLSERNDMVDIGAITFGNAEAPTENKISNLKRSDLKMLKIGLSEKAVVDKFGSPERRDGGSLTVLHYRTPEGTPIRIGFGPDLIWAREVLDGAERDLLK